MKKIILLLLMATLVFNGCGNADDYEKENRDKKHEKIEDSSNETEDIEAAEETEAVEEVAGEAAEEAVEEAAEETEEIGEAENQSEDNLNKQFSIDDIANYLINEFENKDVYNLSAIMPEFMVDYYREEMGYDVIEDSLYAKSNIITKLSLPEGTEIIYTYEINEDISSENQMMFDSFWDEYFPEEKENVTASSEIIIAVNTESERIGIISFYVINYKGSWYLFSGGGSSIGGLG